MARLAFMRKFVPAVFLLGFMALPVHALPIACGDTHRVASLDAALSCTSQKVGSTVHASNINSIFGSTWTIAGELTASGSSGLLSGTGTGWGQGTASGTWFINPSFWNTYGFAVLSMHVGGGNTNYVDSFEWRIINADTSGLWAYNKLNGTGGGMSNLQLWGSGKPTTKVPEPSTLMLMLVGLLSLGLFRRSVK
jgi:hypothetical protein